MSQIRIAAIIGNCQYQDYMERNRVRELERIYCRHGLEHSLDVARVAYIIVLEQRLEFPKEIVYAAGLLHDIGRWQQYDLGLDHASAGAEMAEPILAQAGYSCAEIELVQEAIRTHREPALTTSKLGSILYIADKAVRPCLTCKARTTCKKAEEMHSVQIEQGNLY